MLHKWKSVKIGFEKGEDKLGLSFKNIQGCLSIFDVKCRDLGHFSGFWDTFEVLFSFFRWNFRIQSLLIKI